MRVQDLFGLAEDALVDVVDRVGDDQWELVVPESMTRRPGPWSLRDIVNYHARDDAWVPDVLAGRTIDEVGTAHDGDLLGPDPKTSFRERAVLTADLVRRFDDLDRSVHLTYGDWPAGEYLSHITYFRGMRVYDLAAFIGADVTMPAQLVEGLWEMVVPHAEEWRGYGVLAPEIQVPEDAPLQDRLLGLTGRAPRG